MSMPQVLDGLPSEEPETRSVWRRKNRLRMNEFSASQKNHSAEVIGLQLQSSLMAWRVTSLAVYWPIHDEPNLLKRWAALRHMGFQLALPRVVASDQALSFYSWHFDSRLVKNQWGIAEPEAQAPALALEHIEAMIMPCVGYWPSGYRLGYGGGFYDRTLAHWRSLPLHSAGRRIAIGVAYSECALPRSLPLLTTDQQCDAIITDKGVAYSSSEWAATA